MRNPAFPAEAPRYIPTCCRLVAKPSAIPQAIPPVHKTFLSSLLEGFFESPILSNVKMTGNNTSAPIYERIVLNVYGPTCFPPSLWATKASPQMKAVNKSSKEFLVVCFFKTEPLFRKISIYLVYKQKT